MYTNVKYSGKRVNENRQTQKFMVTAGRASVFSSGQLQAKKESKKRYLGQFCTKNMDYDRRDVTFKLVTCGGHVFSNKTL